MLEQKYKAWDIKEGKMINVNVLHFAVDNSGEWRIQYDGELHGEERFELLQYIGLKDKNKVDLYRADIVLADEKGVNYEVAGDKCIIEWEPKLCRYMVRSINTGLRLSLTMEDCDILKKIGNEFENPKLLLKEKV